MKLTKKQDEFIENRTESENDSQDEYFTEKYFNNNAHDTMKEQ